MELGIQILSLRMAIQNASRLHLQDQRLWIPGSATRPRDDAESVNLVVGTQCRFWQQPDRMSGLQRPHITPYTS